MIFALNISLNLKEEIRIKISLKEIDYLSTIINGLICVFSFYKSL